MKNIIAIVLISFSLTIFSCNKDTYNTVTVVKDCTGTYLRMDGKDYQVCNLEKLSSYADGTIVEVAFKRYKVCNGSANDAVVCMMLHENEGWIQVNKIK